MIKPLRLLSCIAFLGVVGGCNAILGLGDFEDAPNSSAGPGGSNPGGAGPGGEGGTGTQGGSGATGDGGTGDGGGGTGGGTFCEPGHEQDCYTGPDGTQGQGTCIAGVEVCKADGSAYGACAGDVVPAAIDDCATLEDENCDGQPNDGCPCAPNEVQDCYGGPAGTAGVGICHVGTQQCDAQGTMFGPCTGDVGPALETCNTPDDEDCDGQTNEEGAGCVCLPNSTEACYDGPAGTEGVGACKGGQHTCNGQGTAWGACTAQVLPATEACLLAPDEDCDGSSCSEPFWAKGFSGGGSEFANDVGADNAGNVYIAGKLTGTVNFGNGVTVVAAGANDIFLAKFDKTGEAQWAQSFGNASTQSVGAIAVSPTGLVAITGTFQGSVNFGGGVLTSAGSTDIYVARFTSAGVLAWAKRFGDASSQGGKDIVFNSANDVVVIGDYYGQFSFGGGNITLSPAPAQGIWVVQLDGKTGTFEWNRALTSSFGIAMAISADDNGNVYTGGHYSGTGNAGCGSQTTNTGYDGWVAKYNSTGACQWSKLFTGTDNSTIVTHLDVDGTSLWALGRFEGSATIGGFDLTSSGSETQIFLTRLSTATGNGAFAKALGSLDEDLSTGIAAAPNGGVHVAGRFEGTINLGGAAMASNGIHDMFLARFDSDGTHIWSRQYGDAADQGIASIARNGDYDLMVAGSNISVLTFGPFNLASAEGLDIYVAALGH